MDPCSDDAGRDHRRRWSDAHGGTDASGWLVRTWLGGVRRAATPLVRAGASPDAVTLAGLAVALLAALPAAAGGRWALAAAALLGLSGLLDGLDGAVAVLAGASSARGAVLDAVADRLADAAGLAALWLLGAPGPLVVAAGGAGWLAEYARARAQAQGARGPGSITASERPTRVAVAVMFALGAGCYPGSAREWATAGALAAAAAALLGLVQLLLALHRTLRALDEQE